VWGRSVIPWDLVVQRVGGLLYLDVRDGCSLYDTTVRRRSVGIDAPSTTPW
jgi:hypothetical protein